MAKGCGAGVNYILSNDEPLFSESKLSAISKKKIRFKRQGYFVIILYLFTK